MWGRLSGENRQFSLDKFFYCYRPQHIVPSQGIYHFAARKKGLRLMSDMPNSNRNWKGRYFFVQGTDYVCRLEEWATMPHGFDNTWGIVKDSSLTPSIFALTFSIYLISVLMLFFSFFNYSNIIDEQEAFIHRILEISFEQQKCRDLITLDTLHAYCGGPKLTPIARRLNTYSHRHKYYLISPVVFLFVVSWSNTHHLSFVEIEAAR